MTKSMARLGRLSICAVGMLAGCDKAVEPPTTPTGATLQSVTIAGLPAELAVGDRAQLTARATWSDARTEDVTARARWTSASGTCLITPAAMISATEPGACAITAAVDAVSGRAAATVTPARSFTISGVVREKYQLREPPLAGAAVTLASGAQAGRTATADSLGRYVFEGVPRERVTVRANREGFEPAAVEVSPDAPQADLFLGPVNAVLVYDTRVRGNRGEFLTLPFRVTHRGPATLVLTLEKNECGTVESFLTWVRRTTDPTVLFGGSSCRPGTFVTNAVLDPGEYELIAYSTHGGQRLIYVELTYPQ